MKLKLNIIDRIVFDDIVPEKSTLESYDFVDSIAKKFVLSEDEKEKAEFDRKSLTVNAAIAVTIETEIDFTIEELAFLKGLVTKLNQEGKISRKSVSLCRKIRDIN